MELKRTFKSFYLGSRRLLIEPFWNWNPSALLERCLLHRAINRTILELKPGHLNRHFFWVSPINRTILELKLYHIRIKSSSLKLLIEPFWNWNLLEIQSFNNSKSLLIEPFWNWNSDEWVVTVRDEVTINRTILELKHSYINVAPTYISGY